VAVCVYHLLVCVLGALVSGRSVSSQTDLPLTRAPSKHTNRWYTHTATYHVNIQRRKSEEDIIVTAQSTAYDPLRIVE